MVVHRLVFIAADHGHDVRQRRVARGGEIDVDDEKNQHHVSADGVRPGYSLQADAPLLPDGPSAPVGEEQQPDAADPDDGIDHQLHP